jgi:hypothetical protein
MPELIPVVKAKIDKRFLKQYRMISGHKIEFDLFVGGV